MLGSGSGCGSWGLQRCHELPRAHRSSSQPAPNLRKTPSISPNTRPPQHQPRWDRGGQHTGHGGTRPAPRRPAQRDQELLTASSISAPQRHGAAGHGGLRARASRDSPCCHQLSLPGKGLFHLAARLEQQPSAEGNQAGSKAGASLRAYVHSHRDLQANGARGRAARHLERSPGMLHPPSHRPKLKHTQGMGVLSPSPAALRTLCC